MMSNQRRGFFDLVTDLSVFQYGEYNLFNLFYSQYIYQKHEDSDFIKISLQQYFKAFFTIPIYFLSFLVRGLFYRLSKTKKNRILFVRGGNRYSKIGDVTYDLYNARIVAQRGREEFTIVKKIRDGVKAKYQAEFYVFEDLLILITILKWVLYIINRKSLDNYAERILRTYPQLNLNIQNIKKIAAAFYGNYYASRLLLWFIKPRKVLLICHYGKEALIAACKKRNLEVIELMHGSINDSHPHYNYPEGIRQYFKDSMFPDKLAVYGDYWKEKVIQGNMFSEEDVLVIGYYLKTIDNNKMEDKRTNKKTILFTSQWTVVQELKNYISFLKEKLDQNQYQIVIKLHPNEDPTNYDSILEPGFISKTQVDIYQMLGSADIHIGVYSSVMYEAIRYDVANYVLIVDKYEDQCRPIIDSGVALPLKNDQIPDINLKPAVAKEYFFAEYNPGVLFEN